MSKKPKSKEKTCFDKLRHPYPTRGNKKSIITAWANRLKRKDKTNGSV